MFDLVIHRRHGGRDHSCRRRSIRLPEYDYAEPGYYFVTICTKNRERLFGDIVDGVMHLNNIGLSVEDVLLRIRFLYQNADLDEYIVMPDHIHCIVRIHEMTKCGRNSKHIAIVGARPGLAPTMAICLELRPTAPRLIPGSLGAIVGSFKSVTTKTVHRLNPRLHGSIWQRNYYESIIRDADGLSTVREYIRMNPERWETDSYP